VPRAARPQISFADWELLQQGISLEPLLQSICDFLDDHEEVIEAVRRDLERGLKSPGTGRESPLERRSRLLVMALESQEALFEFDQRGEVVWCEDFSLNDGEIDLNLIEPTGVNRCVDKDCVGPLRLHPINGLLTSMS